MSNRAFIFLFAIAVSSLVLNDVARLVFPHVFQTLLTQRTATDEEKKDDNNPTSTLFEEEVKHKTTKERLEFPAIDVLKELDSAIVHLITDDDVRHLAFLPIFSPPPNLA